MLIIVIGILVLLQTEYTAIGVLTIIAGALGIVNEFLKSSKKK